MTFHRIADVTSDDPYDPDTIDATPAQFRRHVETLARIGTPIGMEALLAALDGAELPPNAVMITFDDGYRGCRDVALPILEQLGVPATFFIATEFAGGGKLYWWEQISAALHDARGRSATLAYPHPLLITAGDPGARRVLDDVRALAGAGMDVESHTRRQRVLETLDDEALRDELVGSHRDLEIQLGRAVRALAYPVGRRPPLRIWRAVAEAGYRIGLTNAGGVNHLWSTRLPRFRVGSALAVPRANRAFASDALFLTPIAAPGLAAIRLTHSNRAIRTHVRNAASPHLARLREADSTRIDMTPTLLQLSR